VLIGVYIRLFGRRGDDGATPSWQSIRDAAIAAEAAGFDRVVLEDALLYEADAGNLGLWDPIAIAAAVASATSSIGIAHAVLNNPYWHPGIVARAAATLDEISGGRYRLGIGLGNTPDDYPRFGIAADRRLSRFEESIQVIRDLLRTGRAQFDGEFVHVPDGELPLRGPSPTGPPIVIAAGKPKAMRAAARWADEWNWWTTEPAGYESMRPLVEELERACEEVGRDPATLGRSLDVYSIKPPSASASNSSATEAAGTLLGWRDLGFQEVRVNVAVPDAWSIADAFAAVADVVRLAHAG